MLSWYQLRADPRVNDAPFVGSAKYSWTVVHLRRENGYALEANGAMNTPDRVASRKDVLEPHFVARGTAVTLSCDIRVMLHSSIVFVLCTVREVRRVFSRRDGL